jgi:hypothetical protein
VVVDPQLITPMTMMVLVVRLYDIGLPDDTRNTATGAGRRGRYERGGARRGRVRAFTTLAGPVINGYAFCDPPKQVQINDKAIDGVESHPYQAMFIARLPALPGDRQENPKRARQNQAWHRPAA